MTQLYNNKKQEQEFHLLTPRKVTTSECNNIKSTFQLFNCSDSFVIAEQTLEFNCIGWAIGVREFIDPNREINPHYNARLAYRAAAGYNGKQLFKYDENKSDCMKAVSEFFEAYKDRSVLPHKQYKPADTISGPKDDTIAFYFISGEEGEKPLEGKGFTHAARYIQDVNNWVSEVWTSKLGQYKLVTHGRDELNDSIYGNVLCYLVPDDHSDYKSDL
ncbi:hypothetical protein MIDIC_340023 [Alphaproteobacteria bacterium]